MNKRLLFGILAFFLLVAAAYANVNFTIQSIQIRGLQGISRSTVLSYIHIKPGEKLDQRKSDQVIEDLYKTEFFDNVRLGRVGNTLVISVVQRPIISKISFSGNKTIKTDQLKKVLNKLGFIEGQVFNPSLLDKIKGSLSEEYFSLGKYNAKVTVKQTKLSRNRVAVAIKISEGLISKIQQIKIIGNNVFSERTLLKQFTLTTPGLFTWYTHDDQYTTEKLNADVESLRSFYLDRGYLKFNINSSQVSVSPDRQGVYILVRITEGAQYTVSGYTVSGQLVLSKQKLLSMIDLKKGQVFSRKSVMVINKKIVAALGEKGYANADVNVQPRFNEKNKSVYLNFRIVPGARVYIRHITFSGNYRTNDATLRRENPLFEGGLFSTNKVQNSKRSLLLLPYLSNVNVTTTPVAGSLNKVDLNYNVTEVPSAELQAGVGYSTLEKLMFNAGVSQKNLFGTGNTLGLNFSTSAISTSINLDYYDPYYTMSGVGRDISAYASRYDSSKANISDYATNDYGAAVNYNIPFTLNNSFQIGAGYDNNLVSVSSTPSVQQNKFIKKHGRHFYQFTFNLGWTYMGFDRSLFPTKGASHSIQLMTTVPFSSNSLEYYKAGYNLNYYHPLVKSFLAHIKADVNYGNGYGRYGGSLPFFKNYYSGGMGSVRGFETNELGPKDSNGDAFGGNFGLDGSAGIVLPSFISDTVRTTLFVDAGNVYQTNHREKHYGIKLNELRYSTGIEVDWRSPIALLNFSLATPIHKRSGDDTEVFQFTIGSSV